MKEFVEKLIGRFEEKAKRYRYLYKHCKDDAVVQYDLGRCDGMKESMAIVNQFAEEYNNGWIPCSERLPEANQKVLTCDKNGWISVNVNMPYIGVRNDFECGYYVAWMPLPAPYQKGE